MDDFEFGTPGKVRADEGNGGQDGGKGHLLELSRGDQRPKSGFSTDQPRVAIPAKRPFSNFHEEDSN